MTKVTRRKHEAESDDANSDTDFDETDFDADSDTDFDETDFDADSDDVDSRNEILFERSFWMSFWNARSSSLSTLLNEKWISKNDEQSMTTSLINVYLTE